MSYKIAIASSDGTNIDLSFGEASAFDIYEVDGTEYTLTERRKYDFPENVIPGQPKQSEESGIQAGCGSSEASGGCGSSGNCGTGTGCGSAGGQFPKVELLRDCRCIVCKKIGFHVVKQLEKLAITSFDIDCSVEEALRKITDYLYKIDNHQSLRGTYNKE